MHPAESHFWTINAEMLGNSRAVKKPVAWLSDRSGDDGRFPGPCEPEVAFTPSTVTLLAPFFPWLFLSQNFSAEACASNTICWLNLALSGAAGRGSGAGSPSVGNSLPREGSCARGSRQPAPGSKPLSQPPKPEMRPVTPIPRVSQCSGFQSGFTGVGGLGGFKSRRWMGKKCLTAALLSCPGTQEQTQTPDRMQGWGTILFPRLGKEELSVLCPLDVAVPL